MSSDLHWHNMTRKHTHRQAHTYDDDGGGGDGDDDDDKPLWLTPAQNFDSKSIADSDFKKYINLRKEKKIT